MGRLIDILFLLAEPIVRNGRPPSSHSMHSFLHQYTGSFKKPPLRRPHSVIGGSLGSFMTFPSNGSRLGELHRERNKQTRRCTSTYTLTAHMLAQTLICTRAYVIHTQSFKHVAIFTNDTPTSSTTISNLFSFMVMPHGRHPAAKVSCRGDGHTCACAPGSDRERADGDRGQTGSES
jgi:hypothetical protein